MTDSVDEGNAANRKIKELQTSLADQKSEIEAEKAAKHKVEKQTTEPNNQIDELNSQLADAQSATASQLEANKRTEAALAKMKRDMEERAAAGELAQSALKKKNAQTVNEIQTVIDHLNKAKDNLEKEYAKLHMLNLNASIAQPNIKVNII